MMTKEKTRTGGNRAGLGNAFFRTNSNAILSQYEALTRITLLVIRREGPCDE